MAFGSNFKGNYFIEYIYIFAKYGRVNIYSKLFLFYG